MNIHKINVNEANKEQLATVKGIGASKADEIIRLRNEQGEFKSVEDLQQRVDIQDIEIDHLKRMVEVK